MSHFGDIHTGKVSSLSSAIYVLIGLYPGYVIIITKIDSFLGQSGVKKALPFRAIFSAAWTTNTIIKNNFVTVLNSSAAV